MRGYYIDTHPHHTSNAPPPHHHTRQLLHRRQRLPVQPVLHREHRQCETLLANRPVARWTMPLGGSRFHNNSCSHHYYVCFHYNVPVRRGNGTVQGCGIPHERFRSPDPVRVPTHVQKDAGLCASVHLQQRNEEVRAELRSWIHITYKVRGNVRPGLKLQERQLQRGMRAAPRLHGPDLRLVWGCRQHQRLPQVG